MAIYEVPVTYWVQVEAVDDEVAWKMVADMSDADRTHRDQGGYVGEPQPLDNGDATDD